MGQKAILNLKYSNYGKFILKPFLFPVQILIQIKAWNQFLNIFLLVYFLMLPNVETQQTFSCV